ncbi:MFS transporter [Herbidospora sp. NBRC 101105]|uniref:MFS transporter n=1 Tax=Herbidospora sp. NBRC 101105 TaxID=3032195 RepID=UPI0024A5C9D4|nr:MFS transporter [Herbidospora sp. NBRC 101105]GLX98896.1 MFS transporter [Herbidospora sp. NBRC 101105]
MPRDRQARLATFAVFFVQGLTFSTLLTQVAAMQNKHGLGEGELTLLLLVVPVIAGVGSVVAGQVAARWGSRFMLLYVQPLACAAVALSGWAASVPVLVAALVLFGLGLGGVDAGMNMQGTAVERRYARPVMTGFHALWSLAAVIGAAWASNATGLGLDLGPTFTIVMVPAVVISLAANRWLFGPSEEHVETAAETGPVTIPWLPILPLCLAMAFLYVGDASVSNFGSVYFDQALTAEAWLAPWALGAYQATTFIVRVGGDAAVSRFGPATIVRVGGVVAALGFLLIVVAPDEAVAIAGFALTGVGLSVVAPQSFSAAGRLDPAGTGVAIARVNMFNYVGFIVGAALVGGIGDAAGFQAAFIAPLVLAAGIVVLARGFASPARLPRADGQATGRNR